MSLIFGDLPLETYYNIGLWLSYKELAHSYTISKNFANLRNNQLFWKLKSMHDFNLTSKEYAAASIGTDNDRDTYIKLAGLRNIPIPGAERYGNIKKLIYNAMVMKDYQLFWTFFSKCPSFEVFNEAGKNGLKELIDAAAQKYPACKIQIVGLALCGAAKSGNDELVKNLLDGNTLYISSFAAAAARSGKISTIDLVLESVPREGLNDVIDMATHTAIIAGKTDMVHHMLSRGGKLSNNYFPEAAASGNPDIIDLLLLSGANDYDGAVAAAASKGHLDIVIQMFNLGAQAVDSAFMKAGGSGNIELVKYLIDRGANIDPNDNIIWEALTTAVGMGDMDMVKFLVNIGNLHKFSDDFHDIIFDALEQDNLEMIQYLFQYANPKSYNDYMIIAAEKGYLDIVQFFVAQGADNLSEALNMSTDQPNIQYYLNSLINQE